jgi:hypothetical protein
MNKTIFGIFSVCILFSACDSGNKPSENIIEHKIDSLNKSDEKVCKEVSVAGKKSEVKDDTFIGNVLNFALSRKQVDKSFKDVKSVDKLLRNKYSDGAFDTVRTYKVDCDSVAYIASSENAFPLYASLQSNRISFLNGEITIGLSKIDFIKKMKLKGDVGDCIKVVETEGANEMVFVFKDQKLARILYKNLYVE